MKLIQKWSFGLANALMKKMDRDHKSRFAYYYGFQVWIGSLVKGSLLTLGAISLGCLFQAWTVMIAFAILRSFAGGFHMDTYFKCFTLSFILYIISAFSTVFFVWNLVLVFALILLTYIASLLIIKKYAPAGHPNKPILEENRPRLKKISLWMLHVLMGLSIILLIQGQNSISLSIVYGIFLEVSSIIPIGYKFYGLIGKWRLTPSRPRRIYKNLLRITKDC